MSFVKKLDDKTEFNAIKTGIKTITTLKKHEQQVYNVWFNHFHALGELVPPAKGPLQWIADNHAKVEKYIRGTYVEPKYKASSMRNHLEGLANVLLAVDKDKFKEVVRPMFNFTLTIQQRIDKTKEDSLLSEKDLANFVTYEELVKRRDELEAEWMKDPKNLKLNIYHMVLAVNTYVPPLRLDWLDMNIYPPRVKDGKVMKKRFDAWMFPPPPENDENYLWEEKEGQWAIVINADKIEAKRKDRDLPRQIMRLNDDIEGVTNGKRLNELINTSLTYAPRNYVLVGVKTGEAMGDTGYNAALAAMFKPRKPTQNTLRKAYINYWHRKELSTGKLKDIAHRMRHTLFVAMESYRKINASEIKSAPLEPTKLVAVPEVVIPILSPAEPAVIPIVAEVKAAPIAPPKVYFNPVEYNKEYRKKNAAVLNKKQADKYAAQKEEILLAKNLRKLNLGQVTRPIEGSIEKYKLYQDRFTGKWKSRLVDEPDEG